MKNLTLQSALLAVAVLSLPTFAHACGTDFIDVQVEKSGPRRVQAGQDIVYTITLPAISVQTVMGQPANSLADKQPNWGVIRDIVPAGLKFVSGKNVSAGLHPISRNDPMWGCRLVGNTVECTSPDPLVRPAYELTFETTLNQCQTVRNMATFTSNVTGVTKVSNEVITEITGCATPAPTPTAAPVPTATHSPTPTPTTTPTPTPTLTPIVKAAVVTPRPIAPVPVTAKTGFGSLALVSTLLGGTGIVMIRKWNG